MLKKYASSVLSLVSYAMVAVCVFLCNSSAFALIANPDIDTLVDGEAMKTKIVDQIIGWIATGFTIAVSIYILYLGWRLLRRFLGGDWNQKAF